MSRVDAETLLPAAPAAQTLNDIAVKMDPAPSYKSWREEQPVFFDPGYRMFVVTRHEDVAHIFREPVRFSSARAFFHAYRHEDIVAEVMTAEGHGPLKPVFPMLDPPDHTRIRAQVNLAFSAKRIAKIEGEIRAIVGALLDDLVDRGGMEVFGDFARPAAVAVIGDLLSLPRARWRDVLRWTNAYATCAANRLESPAHAEDMARDLAELQNFIVAHLEERRAHPGDDVLTDLLNADVAGYAPLDDQEIMAIAAGFIGAGHETTTVAITEMIRTLCGRPDVVRDLRAAPNRPAAIRAFVEECLRIDAPVQALPRVAMEDVEIGGVAIPAGSPLLLVVGSANRDAAIFGADAEQLCPARRNATRHMSFGAGVHTCLGNMLARAEMAIVTDMLLDRVDNLRIVAPPAASNHVPLVFDWNYHINRLDIGFDRLT